MKAQRMCRAAGRNASSGSVKASDECLPARMGANSLISKLELRSAQCTMGGRLDYWEFFVDGLPLKERLSFANYDALHNQPEATKAPGSPSPNQVLKLTAYMQSHLEQLNPGRKYGDIIKESLIKYAPTRLGYGSAVEQQEVLQELLLQGQPPQVQKRCRLFVCRLPKCTCHHISAVIERVDDLFVWRDFWSEAVWVGETVELGGGPFYFDKSSYSQVLQSVL
jgi:hypothetical protein